MSTQMADALAARLPELKKKLVARRAQLTEDIDRATRDLAMPADDRGEDLTPSQHPADVAGDLERREDLIVEELLEASQRDAIDAALARIAAGTYGTCLDCGGAILVERLEVLPEAARCTACQRRFDAEARHRA